MYGTVENGLTNQWQLIWNLKLHPSTERKKIIPHVYIFTVNKEVYILEDIGVLKKYETGSKWSAPWLIITKKMVQSD